MLKEQLLQRQYVSPALSLTYWDDTGVAVESSESFVFKELAFSPPRQRCREEKGEGTERKEEQNCGNVFSASYEVSSYKVLDCGYI